MRIAIAHSEQLPLEDNWIYRSVNDPAVRKQVVYDASRVETDHFDEDLLSNYDAIIATIDKPSEFLDRQLYAAHMMCKGVLAFLPVGSNPEVYLPSFAPYPTGTIELPKSRTLYVSKNGHRGTEASIYKGYRPDLKLNVWLASQLMRQNGSVYSEAEFKIEGPDGKQYGAEADQLPLIED